MFLGADTVGRRRKTETRSRRTGAKRKTGGEEEGKRGEKESFTIATKITKGILQGTVFIKPSFDVTIFNLTIFQSENFFTSDEEVRVRRMDQLSGLCEYLQINELEQLNANIRSPNGQSSEQIFEKYV